MSPPVRIGRVQSDDEEMIKRVGDFIHIRHSAKSGTTFNYNFILNMSPRVAQLHGTLRNRSMLNALTRPQILYEWLHACRTMQPFDLHFLSELIGPCFVLQFFTVEDYDIAPELKTLLAYAKDNWDLSSEHIRLILVIAQTDRIEVQGPTKMIKRLLTNDEQMFMSILWSRPTVEVRNHIMMMCRPTLSMLEISVVTNPIQVSLDECRAAIEHLFQLTRDEVHRQHALITQCQSDLSDLKEAIRLHHEEKVARRRNIEARLDRVEKELNFWTIT